MFENTRKFQNMEENFGNMSENAEKREKILGNVRKCKKM